MIISVINHTNGKITDHEAQKVIRAVNRQIQDDFEPYWSLGATLRLEGRSGESPDLRLQDMRGEAVIYLWDRVSQGDPFGYHARNNRGIPYGFVFTEIAEMLDEPWSVTLSHEALELLADPEVNLLVHGPHPEDPSRGVFHWYEMCDAVQAETYSIDHVEVSNFLLPLYFTSGEELGGRNDFLGNHHDGSTLRSFSINPGGYIGFFNPQSGRHETYAMDGDQVAARRIQAKSGAGRMRRGIRYQQQVPDIAQKVKRVARGALTLLKWEP